MTEPQRLPLQTTATPAIPGTTAPPIPAQGPAPGTAVGPALATAPSRSAAHRQRRPPRWLLIFLTGLVLWGATVLVTFVTANSNLIPAIILLGSFLVPVTFVSFAFGRADDVVTTERIFIAFVVGGLLGVLGASLLEAEFASSPSGLGWVLVGLIEEGVKLGALWLIARRLPRYTVRDGIVLGATVGFGFAAFESAGYAFNALFTAHSLSLLNLVETEVLRGILTPLGHGLWTGILGGALFATAAATRRLRPELALLGWYLVVVLMHAFWDASQSIAQWLTLVLTGGPVQYMTPFGQVTGVTQGQVHLYTALSWALLILDGLVSLFILRTRWRAATRVPVPLP
jgi:RsiW-degrading membrane proteinase PrsW (M82 family)